jgi:hypothetical protein
MKSTINYKFLISTAIILFTTSCTNKEKTEELSYLNIEYLKFIDWNQEVRLTQTDDKYGEWGGDTFLIKVYENSLNHTLLADYREFQGLEEPPPPPTEEELKSNLSWDELRTPLVKKDSIPINYNEKELIDKAIRELLQRKIRSENTVSHSGIYNQVILNDSTLIISDSPSFKWNSFQELKKSLLAK